ncbi:hypothetical protein BDV06DRAFT_201690 [Aspergillus oleicola]
MASRFRPLVHPEAPKERIPEVRLLRLEPITVRSKCTVVYRARTRRRGTIAEGES